MGGIVRSTGSGMGCPDWPKCFGNWIPPTSVDQLPENYKEKYAQYRDEKNQKFARYLTLFGMESTAQQILSDESILVEADFNPVKTWIEYLNRLVGAVIGLFIIALVVRSFPLRKSRSRIFFLSVATLVAVIIQGWFGSIVVSTNLTSWTITLHMLLAMAIVGMLIYLLHLSEQERTLIPVTGGVWWLLFAGIILLLIQVFLGAELREAIDALARTLTPRTGWISGAGMTFIIHRSFSWVVLIAAFLFIIKLRKTSSPKILLHTLIILILGTFLSGAAMGYFSVPAVLQPVHLVLATGTFGWQLMILFKLNVVSER